MLFRVKTIEILPEFMKGFPEDDIPELVVRFQHLRDLVRCGDNPEKAEEVRMALATAISLLAGIVREFWCFLLFSIPSLFILES